MTGLIGMVCPGSGQEIRLKLEANRQLLGLIIAHSSLARAHLFADAEQVLDVMSDLMGDDVSSGEVTGRIVAVFHLLEEGEVDVNLLIRGAIKGPEGRAREPTCRLNLPGEEHQTRFSVVPIHFPELLVPDVFGVTKDYRSEILERIMVGLGGGTGRLNGGMGMVLRQIDQMFEVRRPETWSRARESEPRFLRQ